MEMEGKPGMAGVFSTLLEPRFICMFVAEAFVVVVLCLLVRVARRRNRDRWGSCPPRAARRSDLRIKRGFEWVIGTLLSGSEALPGAAAAAATTMAPEPLRQYHEPEADVNIQCQQSETEEQLQPQLSATKEGPEVAIPRKTSPPINIWNRDALKQALRNMIACFKQINHKQLNDDQHRQFERLDFLDHGGVDVIDSFSLFQLDYMIHECQVVFAGNSEFLNRFLCNYFNSADLSMHKWARMDVSQFTYQSAKSCVMSLKVTAGLLCLMSNQLNEAECISFHQFLRDHYFRLCAGQPIENVIKAAENISKLEWSASHIYQMLVLYEAIADVLHAFDYPYESDRIFWHMWVNFKRIFHDILQHNSQCVMTRIRHPVTNFLLQSMELFKSHSSIAQRICASYGFTSLGHLLLKVITYWAEELKKHSGSYTEGKNYIFLLNNLTHLSLEINALLQALMPNSDHGVIHNLLNSWINYYTSEYLKECWRPVLDCVELSSGRKPQWSALDSFTSQFNDICNRQSTWALDSVLKENLREEIRKFIAVPYAKFLERLRKNIFLHARLFFQRLTTGQKARHMTSKELLSAVSAIWN